MKYKTNTNNFMLGTIKHFIVLMDQIIKKKEVITMNLHKHLAVITKSKSATSRPVLQHFHYNSESQSVSVCDSHRILEFKSKETIEKTVNIHYQTMQIADEKLPYPDLQRLKPSKADIVAKIDVKSINPSLLQLLKVYKKEVIKLSFNERQLTLETDHQIITTLPLLETVETCYLYMNCTYFIDLLTFFIDYTKEVNCESLIAGFCGTNRPIFFETENRQFFYLITPIRKKESS